jgi:hypothetical protein
MFGVDEHFDGIAHRGGEGLELASSAPIRATALDTVAPQRLERAFEVAASLGGHDHSHSAIDEELCHLEARSRLPAGHQRAPRRSAHC